MAMKCPQCQHENPDGTIYCGKCGILLRSVRGTDPTNVGPDSRAGRPSDDISVTKTLETPSEQLPIDTTFAGRYHIAGELGKGGMGTVYKVHDTEIKEEVALKLLKPEIASDEHIIERFRNELKIARKVAHKHVCRMFDIGKEDQKYFITMEFVEGQDLKNHIKEKERLSTDEAVSIAKQVCEGLTEAHRLGVVHRDLKPQNIMIDKEGQAKIMDFGIAMSVEAPGMTATGMIIGTPDYISPEQAEGQEADQRSDIYSLGVILYEMVTGTVPFKGDTALSVALKHKSQLPLDPRKINPEVSDDLARLILICMEKDRGRRYQTAEALLDDLRNIEEGFPLGTKIQPRRETFVASLIRKKLFIPALVVVLAIIAIAIWQLLPQKGAAYPPKIENSIAVIGFENQTGDENLDIYQKSIPNAIMTCLEDTGLFHVETWERMRDLLKQMGQDDVEIITSDLGFDACKREGIKSIVLGYYMKSGETFATDIKVLDVDTKQLLKAASSRGEGVDSIFDQIDELSKQISESMGISAQKIEESYTSIKDLTTDSPEAYNYYIRGLEERKKYHFSDAIRFLEKAIEIDPDFATAYRLLGVAYNRLGDRKKAIECFKKAKELSANVTEKEKLRIEKDYALVVEGDQDKAQTISRQLVDKYYTSDVGVRFLAAKELDVRGLFDEAIKEYDKILELDPEHGWAMNSLSYVYAELLNREKAIEFAQRFASRYPGEAHPLEELAEIYLRLGELDAAIAKYTEILEVEPDFRGPEWRLAYLYGLKENYPETLKGMDLSIAKSPNAPKKAEHYRWKGFYYGWLGNITLSFDCFDKAAKMAEGSDYLSSYNKLVVELLKGWIYLDRRESEFAREHFQIGFDLHLNLGEPDRILNFLERLILGLLDLREGNTDSAESRLAEMESLLSELLSDAWYATKEMGKYYTALLRAEIHLFKNSVDEAIAISKKASIIMIPSTGRGFDWIFLYNFPFQRDVLARAYRQKGDLDKAIDWYEKHIIIDPKTTDRRLIPPKYHYKLAVLYEEKGRKSKAIAQYEKFLDLWKDADPGIAEVEDAQKRLTGLKSE